MTKKQIKIGSETFVLQNNFKDLNKIESLLSAELENVSYNNQMLQNITISALLRDDNVVCTLGTIFNGFEAEVLFACTQKSEQRKGLAFFLLQNFLNDNPCDIFLEVEQNNLPAISLYKKLGFNEISARKNYYGNGKNALILKKSKEN